MPNALLPDQYASGMSGSSGWNPSRAVNAGLFASGFAPSGIGQLLNLGYGGYQGFSGQTSQNNEGLLGYLDPTEPSMWQNAGNWMGSGIASLLGYGHPQMSMAQGQAGDNQSYGSSMQGGNPSSGMALNPDGSPSDAQLQFAANGWGLSGPRVPSLNYDRSSGGASIGGFSGVGYAPGADFMSGFGSQGGGYSGGGSYPGLRTLVR